MSESYVLKDTDNDLIATVYGIYLFQTNLSDNDIYSIQNTLKRYKEKYPYVSYLLVVSDTDHKGCVRRQIKLDQGRGRYKTIVIGKKIERHIHLAVIGDENNSARECAEEIKEAFNKRFKGKKCIFCSKGKSTHAKNFINYCLRQANQVNKSGIFNQLLVKKEIPKIDYF